MSRSFGLGWVALTGAAFVAGGAARWAVGLRAERAIDAVTTRVAGAAPLDPARPAKRVLDDIAASGAVGERTAAERRVALRAAWLAAHPDSWSQPSLLAAQTRDLAVAGSLEAALDGHDRAVAAEPDSVRARALASDATLAIEHGRPDLAVERLRRALPLAGHDRMRGELALTLGDLEVSLGRDAAAMDAYRLALDVSPQPAKRHAAGIALGWCFLRARRPAEASAQFERGLAAAGPRDGAAWLWGLAHARHALGNPEGAREALERLAASPDAGELATRARTALADWKR